MSNPLIDDALWANIRKKQREEFPVDLYLWWAIFSDFRVSYPRNGSFPRTISFIAERYTDNTKDAAEFHQKFAKLRCAPIVNAVYAAPILAATGSLKDANTMSASGLSKASAKRTASSFFTFAVLVPVLPTFVRNGRQVSPANGSKLKEVLFELFTQSGLKRLQLGFPRGKFANANITLGAVPDLRTEEAVTAQCESDVVIGVVDNGAAFAHGSLRDSSGIRTRLVTVWNQSRELGEFNRDFWCQSSCDWYGAVLPKKQMDDAMCRSQRPGQIDEISCYESLFVDRESQRVLNNRDTHGAAVLTCVAGAINPSWMITSSLDAAESPRARVIDDAASRAPVIFVDLPFETTSVSSGRWMPVAALDAVRFILDEANQRYCKKLGTEGFASEPVPVVINISSGSNAGSRDGHSMFESALSELLNAYPTLSVTVAAGNARLSGSHAKRVIPAGQTRGLVVRIPAAKRGETYVEFWPEWEDQSATESLSIYASQLKFSLVTPNATVLSLVGSEKDGGALLRDGDGEVVAGLNFVVNAVQSVGRPMALLVVAATAPLRPYPHAPYGDWTVRCHNTTGRNVRIKAWIERDDIVFGVRRPQLAHFCESGNVAPPINKWIDDDRSVVSRYDTFSNLANAKHAFSVGAALGPRDDGYASPYSGGGSIDRSVRPLLMARADRSSAKPGMPVFGAYGSARQHMNGTSIAAPQAARWIANYIATGRDRHDVHTLAQCSVPREHPHLLDPSTGKRRVASGEGNWFVDPNDPSAELCLGKPR